MMSSPPSSSLSRPLSRRKPVSKLALPVSSDGVTAPVLGAIVRLLYQSLRRRIFQALAEHGYGNLTETELNLFQASGPDRARPIDLAQRCHMSKQSMNYVLSHMEKSGYIERRAAEDGDNRLVYLTARGWKLYNLVRRAINDAEADWAMNAGKRRYETFRDIAEDIILAEQERQDGAPAPAIPRRRRPPISAV